MGSGLVTPTDSHLSVMSVSHLSWRDRIPNTVVHGYYPTTHSSPPPPPIQYSYMHITVGWSDFRESKKLGTLAISEQNCLWTPITKFHI